MVIFNSYVKLPEGISKLGWFYFDVMTRACKRPFGKYALEFDVIAVSSAGWNDCSLSQPREG